MAGIGGDLAAKLAAVGLIPARASRTLTEFLAGYVEGRRAERLVERHAPAYVTVDERRTALLNPMIRANPTPPRVWRSCGTARQL